MKKRILVIAGPTASGKSDLALKLAEHLPIVIINADSKQLYKEIPIITAQPNDADKQKVEHQLYGNISSSINCSVGKWIELAKEKINLCWQQNKVPVLVGGTGMYLKSIEYGIATIPDIDENIRQHTRELFNEIGSERFYSELIKIDKTIIDKIKPTDSQRLCRAYEVLEQTSKSITWWQKQPLKRIFEDVEFKSFFLNLPRKEIYNNCNQRFLNMIENGAIKEVEQLLKMNLKEDLPAMKSYGVPEIRDYIHQNISLDEAVTIAQKHSRHYIKRQVTWFKNQMTSYEDLQTTSIENILNKI